MVLKLHEKFFPPTFTFSRGLNCADFGVLPDQCYRFCVSLEYIVFLFGLL